MSNGVNFYELAPDLRRQLTEAQAELAAIKAQEPVAGSCGCTGLCDQRGLASDEVDVTCKAVYAAPAVSAEQQGGGWRMVGAI